MSTQDIAAIVREEWCAMLDVTATEPDADFFRLGGDSLMAVELVERLEQRLRISFPLEALFVEGSLGAVTSACIMSAAEDRNSD